jgi:hypothetical protein
MGAASTEQQSRSSARVGASGTASASTSASPSSQREVAGLVESFDHASNTFRISGTSVKVDSSTEVLKDGQRASLTDVQEGDEVRASFSGSGDAATANRIEVTSSRAGTSGAGMESGSQPAGRGGPRGPGTGTGHGDSGGTTSGTGTGSAGATDSPSGSK